MTTFIPTISVYHSSCLDPGPGGIGQVVKYQPQIWDISRGSPDISYFWH